MNLDQRKDLEAKFLRLVQSAEEEQHYFLAETTPEDQDSVRFIPSRAEGLPDVEEVVVRGDRLEIKTDGSCVTYLFAKIGRRQEAAAWSFLKRVIGMEHYPPMVGMRDCIEGFFHWFTDPPLRT